MALNAVHSRDKMLVTGTAWQGEKTCDGELRMSGCIPAAAERSWYLTPAIRNYGRAASSRLTFPESRA